MPSVPPPAYLSHCVAQGDLLPSASTHTHTHTHTHSLSLHLSLSPTYTHTHTCTHTHTHTHTHTLNTTITVVEFYDGLPLKFHDWMKIDELEIIRRLMEMFQ